MVGFFVSLFLHGLEHQEALAVGHEVILGEVGSVKQHFGKNIYEAAKKKRESYPFEITTKRKLYLNGNFTNSSGFCFGFQWANL